MVGDHNPVYTIKSELLKFRFTVVMVPFYSIIIRRKEGDKNEACPFQQK